MKSFPFEVQKDFDDKFNCDCLEKIITKEMKLNDNIYCFGFDWFKLDYSIKRFTLKGNISERFEHHGKHFKFCPFCGKKLKGEIKK